MERRDPTSEALARGLGDSALLVAGALGGALLGLVSLRLLLTSLSEEDYGRYSLFLAAAGLLAVGLTWPVPAAIRLGAEEVEGQRSLGRTAASTLTLLALGALIAGAVAVTWREPLQALIGAPLVGLAAAYALASALAHWSATLLQPAGRVGLRTLAPAATRALFAGLLALLALRGEPLTLERAVFLCVVTAVPGVALPLVALGRRLAPFVPSADALRRAAAFGAPRALEGLGVAGVLYVDVLAVRHFLGPAAAGRYDVAYRLAEQAVVLGLVVPFLFAPPLASAAARGERGALGRFYRLAAPQVAWLWGLAAALLIALAEPLLTALGARSPAASAAALRLLGVAVALRGVGLVEGAVLEAHLLSRWPMVFFFAGFAVNLGLDVALLSAGWGLTGPALATVAGFGVQALLRAGYLRRALGVPAARPYLGVIPPLAVAAVAVGAGTAAALAAWAALAAAVVVGGRRLGLFCGEGRALLAEVRMPGVVRDLVLRLYPREEGAP